MVFFLAGWLITAQLSCLATPEHTIPAVTVGCSRLQGKRGVHGRVCTTHVCACSSTQRWMNVPGDLLLQCFKVNPVINFEIKFWCPLNMGSFNGLLFSKSQSPNGTVGLLDAHVSVPDLICLLYKSKNIFVDLLCSYLGQDGQNSSSRRNLICCLHDCPSSALHRNYKGWSLVWCLGLLQGIRIGKKEPNLPVRS